MAEITVKRQMQLGPFSGVRLSWGGIFGGTLVAIAISVMLYALGLAIGLGRIDPGEERGFAAAGIGIWALVASLIGLFIGGFVAARSVSFADAWTRILHGTVVWALSSVLVLFLAGSMVARIVGGAVGVAGRAVGATGQVIAQGADPLQSALGISTQDLLAPINRRLQAEGKPPVTAEGVQQTVQDVVNQSLRTGQFNRELLVSSLAENTALSRQDAEEVAAQVEARFQAMGQSVGGAAQTFMGRAAEVSSDISWAVFFTLLLGLGSSILGGLVSGRRRPLGKEEAVVEPPVTRPPREVYP